MAPNSSRNETDRGQSGGIAARLGATLSTLLLLLSVFAAAALPQQRPGLPSKRVTTSKNAPSGPKYRPGRVLVRFRSGTAKQTIASAHAAVQAEVVKEYRYVKDLQAVRLPEGRQVEEAIQKYRKNPNVLYAQPDYAVHMADGGPNDPYYLSGYLWGLNMISAPAAWGLTTGSSNVVVVGIDTGIDYSHPDLAANMFRNTPECTNNGSDDDGDGFIDDCYGINAITGSGNPMDDNGHGTHTAGTIGAVGNNNLGVVGVNWNVQIMACKFLDAYGNGYDSDAITCLDYVAFMKDRGVNIVATNNSWGSPPGLDLGPALRDAIDVQRQKGILFIAAAGNDYNDNDVLPAFPASYDLPNIISVAATDAGDYRAGFSNYGQHTVHLGAPGVGILSTWPGGLYEYDYGTSMATPHVTGVAALLAAQDPTRDWRAIKNLILAGADVNESTWYTSTITRARLNAYGALMCTDSAIYPTLRPIPSYATETPSITVGPGAPVDLKVLNINCALPNGDVPISVYSYQTDQTQTVTLLDDGVGADQVAGDGIYSGQWIPPAVGGYDLYGFPDETYINAQAVPPYLFGSTAYNYVPIAGTNLELSDDDANYVTLSALTPPLSIPFGGGSYSTIYVGSNGVLSFTEGIPWTSGSLPTPYFQTVVAPFWTDLYPIPGTDQNVFWDVVGTAPNRQLVIEWRNLPFCCTASATETVTFEVVFSENSPNIVFNYLDTVFGGSTSFADHGAAATVGVQVGYDFGTVFSMYQPTLNDSSAIAWQLQSPVVLSPASLNFGNVVVGSSAPQTITLSNVGGATVTISTIAGSGDFAVTGGTCSPSLAVAAGSNCTIIVTFTPSALGDHSGTLSVADDALGSPQTANLAGRGVSTGGAVVSVPAALGFGDQQRGTTSAPLTATLTNSGAGLLGILSVQISGDFALAGGTTCPTTTGSLAPGASCAFLVTFTPVLDGPRKGALVITHDAAGSPLQLSLSGNGTPNFLTAGLTWRQRAGFQDPRAGYDDGPSMGGGVVLAAASLINGMLYVSHGYEGYDDVSYLSIYNVGTDSWTYGGPTAPDANYPREDLGAGIANGKHYAIGGWGYSGEGSGALGVNEEFDPSSHTWTSILAPLPTPAYYPGSASWNDMLYLIGGYDADWNVLSLNQVYDPATDAWANLAPLPTPVAENATVAYDGKIYVFGGWTLGGDPVGAGSLVHIHARAKAQTSEASPLTDAVEIYDIASDKWTTGAPMLAARGGAMTGVIGNKIAVFGGYDSFDNITSETFLYDPATDSWSLGPDMSAAVAYMAQGVTGDGTQVFSVGGWDINWNISGAVQLLQPALQIEPTSLTFSDQAIGTTSPSLVVDLDNRSDSAAITISNVQITGDFEVANEGCTTIAPGSDCLLTVNFTPTDAGARTGTLTFTESGSLFSPHVINLSGNGVGPLVSLSASSLTFSSQRVGATSSAQAITLTNNGNAALTINSITTTADFAQTNGCGSSVAAGANCAINVTFTPPTIGNTSGFLIIDDNAAGGPHTVVLSGTGVGPAVTLSATSLAFGNQAVGTPSTAQTVTLTNSGNATLTFTSYSTSAGYTQTNTCGTSLAAGTPCTISVTFTPSAPGSASGVLIIADDAPNSPQSISLSGTGTGPITNLSSSSISFGNQSVGTTSAAQTVTLTNAGNAALTVTSIATTAGFAQTNTCGTSVAAGANCTISLTFSPSAPGAGSGILIITDSAPGSPHTVSLSGKGIGPAVSLSATGLTFTDQQAGTTSAAQTVTVTNSGNAPLNVTNIASSGDFARTNTCSGPIAGGASCTISVTFSPTAIGSLTGVLLISDDAPNSPQTVSLAGSGIGPFAAPAPAVLTFASQLVATKSSTQTVTLTNTGTQPLTIKGIGISSDFAQSSNCGSSLSPQASCTFNIAFTPQAAGARTGTLSITDNAYGSPHLIALSGLATDFSIGSAAGAPAPTVSIAAGQTATFNLSIAGSQGFNGTVSFGCSGVPEASTCSVSPKQVAVDGTTPAGVKVMVQTTARSMTSPLAEPRALPPVAGRWLGGWLFLWLLLTASLFSLAGRITARTDKRRLWLRLATPVGVMVFLVLLWASCGGGGGQYAPSQPTGTPAGTYSLTVTGTYTAASGQGSTLSHNITLTLNVN